MQKSIVIRRVSISMILGILIGLVLSELGFHFLGQTARVPKDFTITIPVGTAEEVAGGETPPSLPDNIIFVVGDRLIVKNEDKVDHQLGPLWIPAHSTGELYLGLPESLAYECSFQVDRIFELDVREPLTPGTRIYGILFAGIPMGILISLYAVILPDKKKNDPADDVQP